MNVTIRRMLTANRLSRLLYFAARQAYHTRRVARRAGRYFRNADEFKKALGAYGVAAQLDLRTADGHTITIRQNCGDAMTVAEIFLDDCYVRDLTLPPQPGHYRYRRLYRRLFLVRGEASQRAQSGRL